MKKYILIFLLLVSCSSGKNDSQSFYHGFTNNTWELGEKVSFPFEIIDTSAHYNVDGKLKVAKSFTFSSFNMGIITQTPSGSTRYKKINILLRNDFGERNGEIINNYQEITFPIYNEMKFSEQGKWNLTFEHNMPIDIHEGIIALELFINKNK